MQTDMATSQDLTAITKLLADSALPIAGIDAPDVRFIVLREGATIIATAAIEGEAPEGLLRSVVVDQTHRQQGVGTALIGQVVAEAKLLGYTSLYLLTETAAPFFARLGFDTIPRESAPAVIRSSAEFEALCPVSATCMTLLLSSYKFQHYAKR